MAKFIPQEYLDDDSEDWLRAGRRMFLLLNVIYYLQKVAGRSDGVKLEEIRDFVERLKDVSTGIYGSIVKPKKPLEHTLHELLQSGDILKTEDGKFLVNEEVIDSERKLVYWKNMRKVFDKVRW